MIGLERSRAERLGESTGGGGLLSVVAPLDSVFSIHGGRSILACRPELGGWILLKYLSLGQIWSLESLYHFPLHLLPMVFVPPPSPGLQLELPLWPLGPSPHLLCFLLPLLVLPQRAEPERLSLCHCA